MGFTKKTWADRVVEFANRRVLTKSDSTTETVTVARSEGVVSTEGDAFSAANMNDLENRIATAFGITLTLTLTAGSTSVTFTNETITSASMITPYTDTFGVNPTNIETTAGSCTLSFDAQDSAVSVRIEVR